MLGPKKSSYYKGIREDIIELFDGEESRVMDVGCGAGLTGERLKAIGASEVVGLEINPEACREARPRLDKIIPGDVEKITLPFKDEYFDYIIYADVLEHLIDPWAVLDKHKRLLKAKGIVIASIPNLRHYRVIKKLLRGKWNYEETGVLDSTHLRFFTLYSINRMFEIAGYRIEKIVYKISASKTKKFFNRISGGKLNEVLAEQFLIKAVKK